jgi:hypothetical protein
MRARKELAVLALSAGWALGLPATSMAVPVEGGSTVVTLDLASDPNFVAVAGANGIAPAAIPPGTLGGDPLAFAFPITSVSDTNVLHSGGISLTQEDTVLMLTDFDINLTTLTLFGMAMLGDTVVGVLPLFNVDGSTLALSLTSGAADALNNVFATGLEGAPVFADGLPVGTASFVSVPEPGSLAMFLLGLTGILTMRRKAAA